MLAWIINFFARFTSSYTHAIAMIHNITLYCHIKGVTFAQFMIWAFGDNWKTVPITQLHTVWNQRHGTISKANTVKDLSSLIYQMIDWYISINKPV